MPNPIPVPAHPLRDLAALRAIALLEAAKGALVLLVGFGSVFFVHRDLVRFAGGLLRRLHLDPASHFAFIVFRTAERVEHIDLRVVLLVASLYAIVRFAEAVGLWGDRAWGEWIGALSGGIYLPFEIHELFLRQTALRAGLLAANLFIVGFLCWHLYERRQLKRAAAARDATV